MEYVEILVEGVGEFLNNLDWKDLDNNPSICRAEILNKDVESYLGGLRKFEFNGCFFSVELINSDRSYLVAY